jgi:hypothetical protein
MAGNLNMKKRGMSPGWPCEQTNTTSFGDTPWFTAASLKSLKILNNSYSSNLVL